jgi:protein-S-isoprenylcysteine O-methyltransferase Ste14
VRVADRAGSHRIAAWIARRRVAAGFLLGAAAFWLAQPTPRSLAIGSAIAVLGEAIRIWAAGHLEKGREVTASGPYAITRHPLYLGSSIIGVGVAIASARILIGVLVLAYLAVSISAAIRTEEAQLTERFGAQYPAYRAGQAAGATRRFSPARAMRNREYRAMLGLAIALALFAWKALR